MRVPILLAGLAVLAACDASAPGTATEPETTAEIASLTASPSWVLVSFSETDVVRPSTIAFADSNGVAEGDEWAGEASGLAACNRYVGTFTAPDLAGGDLAIYVDGITEIACGDSDDAYERVYAEALEAVTSFVMMGNGRLRMTGAEGLELVFEQGG